MISYFGETFCCQKTSIEVKNLFIKLGKIIKNDYVLGWVTYETNFHFWLDSGCLSNIISVFSSAIIPLNCFIFFIKSWFFYFKASVIATPSLQVFLSDSLSFII